MLRRVLAALAALVFALPVAASWIEPGIPGRVKLISVAMCAAAVLRPQWALCVLAFVLPVAPRLVLQVDAPFSSGEMAELLVAAFLCAASLRASLESRHDGGRLIWPAALMASVVAAAGLIGLRVEQLSTAFPSDFIASLRHHWLTSYFGDQSSFVSLHIAMTWIEALALAAIAERLVRANPRSASGIVGWFLAGATLASWFAWLRVIEVSRRHGFGASDLWHLLMTQRISTLYADANAAGSLFAMYLVAAVWLAFTGGRRWRWLWPAAMVILGALWVTGSRTALAAAVVGLAAAWFASSGRSRRTLILGAAAGAVLIAGVLLWNPGRNAQSSFGESFKVRRAMAQIAGQAVAASPAFGIGLGQFRNFAREHASPELIELFPAAAHGENAHNNFLQVLAELGAIGLLAFLWTIGAAAGAVIAAARRGRPHPATIGIAGGLLTFCVTCLGGHPLLIVEVLFLFFLAIGLTAGFGPMAPGAWSRRAALAIIGVVLVSAPVRFWLVRQNADLDRQVIGAGPLTDADYGVEYRIAEPRSAWFISARARTVDIPMRLARGSRRPCLVRIDIDGRTVNSVEPAADEWTHVTFQFDPARKGPVSREIDLDVQGGACGLLVGQLKTRE
jgi:O-antigen ligase